MATNRFATMKALLGDEKNLFAILYLLRDMGTEKAIMPPVIHDGILVYLEMPEYIKFMTGGGVTQGTEVAKITGDPGQYKIEIRGVGWFQAETLVEALDQAHDLLCDEFHQIAAVFKTPPFDVSPEEFFGVL